MLEKQALLATEPSPQTLNYVNVEYFKVTFHQHFLEFSFILSILDNRLQFATDIRSWVS